MTKTKKTRYSGVLAKPMVLYGAPTLANLLLGAEPTKEEKQVNEAKNAEQVAERMLAIFAHYDIDPKKTDADAALLVALLKTHVPGFRYKDPDQRAKGRPSKWKSFKAVELFADVKSLVSEGSSARNACRILATSPRYKERYKDETVENLYRRYQEVGPTVAIYVRYFSDRIEMARAAGKTYDQWLIESFALREKF